MINKFKPGDKVQRTKNFGDQFDLDLNKIYTVKNSNRFTFEENDDNDKSYDPKNFKLAELSDPLFYTGEL